MHNRARDIFNQFLEEDNARTKKKNEEFQSLIKRLQKDIEPFLKAARKFAETGEVDAKGLNLNDKDDWKELVQESVGEKRTRRKKVSILQESSTSNVKVKKEKISEISQPQSGRSSTTSTTSSIVEVTKENIKVEKDDMPAPSWVPPKKKVKEIKTERPSVRGTRTKGKKGTVRDSDVVIQNSTITTINLSDTDESDVEKIETDETKQKRTRKPAQNLDTDNNTDTESTRSTRTKTRKKKDEAIIAGEEVVEETRSTRTKTLRKAGKKPEEENTQAQLEESQPEKRSTRTKTIRKGKGNEEVENDIPNNNNKDDSEPESTRSTRTKTKKPVETAAVQTPSTKYSKKPIEVQKTDSTITEKNSKAKSKRIRSDSTDEEFTVNKEKKSKSNSPVRDVKADTTTQTVYEDARSTLGPAQQKQLDSTFVATKPTKSTAVVPPVPPLNSTITIAPKPSPALNSTVIVDHPKSNKIYHSEMFTDDESSGEVKTPPPKEVLIKKSTKEVFSPYEKTTLKKKVEAFEKLQNGHEIPKAFSTSKTRDTPSAVKEKAKMFTPVATKFLPSSSSTTKISRLISNHQQNSTTINDSMLGSKSAQKDPRERHRKLLEREQALKKKEAMLQAQADAKRKHNEEKQLKAQQQRKALEAEKIKQLELQKLKEEKLKQRELEREEYLQKQKLEMEKKRLAQKKKYQEIQAQRLQAELAQHRPVYLTTQPQKLPTDDCYDSDDPEYQEYSKKFRKPSWSEDDRVKKRQLSMLTAGEKIKNTLFCRHAQTPDLKEIFETIDPKKLKRSSSRLWRAPPRYTMMPDLNETKFSDDDELYESD